MSIATTVEAELGNLILGALTNVVSRYRTPEPPLIDPTPQNFQIMARSQLPLLLNKLGLHGDGVEVGVLMGRNSFRLLNYSKLRTLYCIDPWIEFMQEDYIDSLGNVPNKRQNSRYLITVMRLSEFLTRAVILRMTSKTSVKLFKENSLDFVYIDANHSYEACKQDINLWWPKVSIGGIFSGHDYKNTDTFGVKRAVDEFAAKHEQKLYTTAEVDSPSWYIIKQ